MLLDTERRDRFFAIRSRTASNNSTLISPWYMPSKKYLTFMV